MTGHILMRSIVLAAAAIAVGAGPAAAAGDGAEEFYKGRQLTLLVSAGAGGGYGLYSQLFAKHLSRHLPGKPTVVLQYMGEAGGQKAANHLYNIAPKDGSWIGTLRTTTILAQELRPSGAKYESDKFTWVGSMAPMVNTIGVWHSAPATSVDALKTQQVIVGAEGKSSELYMQPMIMNKLVGTKFKIVTGYRGTNDVRVAMERGEVHGTAMAWLIWKAEAPQWLKENKVVHVAQTGLERLKDLPNVPTLLELAKNDEDRQIMMLITVPSVLGRSVSAPPGVAKDRVAFLRRVFDQTMRDPAFHADAKERNIEIEPMSGPEVEKLVHQTMQTPPALLQRAKALLEF